jgi:hypothetical protein
MLGGITGRPRRAGFFFEPPSLPLTEGGASWAAAGGPTIFERVGTIGSETEPVIRRLGVGCGVSSSSAGSGVPGGPSSIQSSSPGASTVIVGFLASLVSVHRAMERRAEL